MAIYLITAKAHDGTSERTVYLATAGYTTRPTDSPANQYFEPRIVDPGNIERRIMGAGSVHLSSSAGSGDIVVASGDTGGGETLDAWLSWSWDGRDIVIDRIESDASLYSSRVRVFRGRIEQIVSDNAYKTLSIRIYDRLADLDKPLLSNRYAGNVSGAGSNVEGTVDLANKVKPKLWGSNLNVPCVLVNPYSLIYQVSDGAVASIVAYDGGAALTLASNVSTASALASVSLSAGQYATCLTLGLFKLGALPEKEVTADVVEGSAGTNSAVKIVRRMMTHFGLPDSDIDIGSFTLADFYTSDVGYRVDDDSTTLSAAMGVVLASVWVWVIPDRDGVFVAGLFIPPSNSVVVAASFNEAHVIGRVLQRLPSGDGGRGIPVKQVTARYGYLGVTQANDAVLGTVTPARRAYLEAPYREATAYNAPVAALHPYAPILVIETRFVEDTWAAVRAALVMTLHGARRDLYRITVSVADGYQVEVGRQVRLTFSRFGLSSGKLFIVVGRVDEFAADRITLDLWG